jgi:hypothetical protein
MEQRAAREDRQVKCLIASAGHEWMVGYFDRLPSPVRRRLADSRFNICAACMTEEAERMAKVCGRRRPIITDFFTAIEAIERRLDAPPA